MSKSLRQLLSLVVIVVLVFAFASCGNTKEAPDTSDSPSTAAETKSTGTPEKEQEPVKLRASWWGSDQRHELTQKVMELYTQKNPNITFEVNFSAYDGYFEKLATTTAAKNAPDIFQMDSHIGEYAENNQLAEITNVNTADLDKALLETGVRLGKQYGIPLGNNATCIVYNKSALEKLGIAPPENGWTWDEYFAYGREVQKKLGKGQYALFDAANDMNTYDAFQMSKGKGRKNTPEGKFNIDKETFIEWLAIHAELREEGVVPPASITFTDVSTNATEDLMVKGTTIFRKVGYVAQLSSWNNLLPDSIGVVTAPKDIESGDNLQPSMFWSVSASSPYIEEAQKFIDWYINDLEAADILMTVRGVPVSNKVLKYLEPKLTPIDKMGINHIAVVAPTAQSYVMPGGWGSWEADFRVIVEKEMFKKQSAEDTYEELVKKGMEYEKN